MRALIFVAALVMLASCAATTDRHGYSTQYRLEGATEMVDANAIEQLHQAASAAVLANRFDSDIRLIRSPPPVMSPEDTDKRVAGSVVVDVVFSESSDVEGVTVVRSTKDSLSESAKAAVRQWRITPATRSGKPSKVVVRQTFEFNVL